MNNKTIEYNYDLQVWVVDGIIENCNHDDCNGWTCNQRIYAGQTIDQVKEN